MSPFRNLFRWWMIVTGLLECLACHGQMPTPGQPTCSQPKCGEFGSDLRYLRRYYSGPQRSDESNHFFDLWEGQTLKEVAGVSGLKDNHALLINSHGQSLGVGGETRYAIYPHQSLVKGNQKAPNFSLGDVAKVLGPTQAGGIHNILIAGCNSEGSLSSAEVRKFFPNATNIIHAVAGELGYQSMFLQVLLCPSEDIKPIYESKGTQPSGRAGYHLGHEPGCQTKKLTPYVADLFQPGANEPFQTRIAGRELLEAGSTPAPENITVHD